MDATDEKNTKLSRYNVALRRMNCLKDFYWHLLLYLLASLLILLTEPYLIRLLESEGINDPDFLKWVHWNLVLTPFIWGIILQVHATFVFWHRLKRFFVRLTPGFIYKWEERQIRKFMEEDSIK